MLEQDMNELSMSSVSASKASQEISVELLPGTPFCSTQELNRIARQQGLCLAIAQAVVLDEICRVVALAPACEDALLHRYRQSQGLEEDSILALHLEAKGWAEEDLRYFATKGERIRVFRDRVFEQEVEIRFLERKLDFDQVSYSLIRTTDANLAFELHQRLIEGEATFEDLAAAHSEGPERETKGAIGPYPLTQAHPDLAEKLRISQPGQLHSPFFLVNIWLILRLDRWEGARLENELREEILSELFNDWFDERVRNLLEGLTPPSLPLHLLT